VARGGADAECKGLGGKFVAIGDTEAGYEGFAFLLAVSFPTVIFGTTAGDEIGDWTDEAVVVSGERALSAKELGAVPNIEPLAPVFPEACCSPRVVCKLLWSESVGILAPSPVGSGTFTDLDMVEGPGSLLEGCRLPESLISPSRSGRRKSCESNKQQQCERSRAAAIPLSTNSEAVALDGVAVVEEESRRPVVGPCELFFDVSSPLK
jgi:hypothetical protein